MTNTGDFRRYSYSTDASYALQAFNQSRSSAAPAYRPETKRDFKVRGNSARKSSAELVNEQKIGFAKIVKILTISLLSLSMFFGMLYMNAQKNELNHEIANLEYELSVAESENTRINSELNALVSVSMIDEYAVEKLGMSKVQSNQIRYINVSQFKEKHISAAQQFIENNKNAAGNTALNANK